MEAYKQIRCADPALPGRDETSALDFIDAAETAVLQIVFLSLQAARRVALQPEQREVDEKPQLFIAHHGG